MTDIVRRIRAKSAAVLIVLALAAMSIGAPPQARAQDTLRAVAVVNDEVVSMLDLVMRARLSVLSAGIPITDQALARVQRQVLRRLIDEQLQLQEADRLGIELTEDEIGEVLGSIAQRNGMSRDQFKAMLLKNQILPTAMEQRVRAELAWQHVIRIRLVPTVIIADEEINEFAARMVASRDSPEVYLMEIFLEVDTVLAEDEVRRSAVRLMEQLAEGADFGALATQFSQSATAPVGGDMGWVQEAQLPEDLLPAVRQMEAGQIAGPVRTFSGFHILLLRQRRQMTDTAATVNLKQVLFAVPPEPTEQQIAEQMAQAARLRDSIGSCADADRVAAESGSPGSGDLGRLTLGDLPDNLRNVVQSLPLEQPSEPLQVAGGVALLVVCDRQGSPLDREKIERSLLTQRINVLARRYLHDLRRAANVDVRL